MIFLSKRGGDTVIGALAQSIGAPVSGLLTDFDYESSSDPIFLRGILKYKLMHRCWADHRDFYYVDTGYMGNQIGPRNKHGLKLWHRIVKNDLQHETVIRRPDDRFQKLDVKIEPRKKGGRKILIAAPDGKPCRFYGIEKKQWLESTIATLKQHTDRPIEVRERTKNRQVRIVNDTLRQALDKDVYALVTYNSNAATEAALAGWPVFVTAPTHAARPVSGGNLSQIESPVEQDMDKIYEWACHLAYGQFHIREIMNGTAMRILLNG